MEGKICNTCYCFKSLYFFAKEKTCADGYRGKCKECDRERKQKNYILNKEKYKKAYNEFIERNPNYQCEYYLKNSKAKILKNSKAKILKKKPY